MARSYTVLAVNPSDKSIVVNFINGADALTLALHAPPQGADANAWIMGYWPSSEFSRRAGQIDAAALDAMIGQAVVIADGTFVLNDALDAGCQISCASNPALNGSYPLDTEHLFYIDGIQTQINAGKGLPGGQSTVAIPDVTGTTHDFDAPHLTEYGVALSTYFLALQGAAAGGPIPQQPVPIT